MRRRSRDAIAYRPVVYGDNQGTLRYQLLVHNRTWTRGNADNDNHLATRHHYHGGGIHFDKRGVGIGVAFLCAPPHRLQPSASAHGYRTICPCSLRSDGAMLSGYDVDNQQLAAPCCENTYGGGAILCGYEGGASEDTRRVFAVCKKKN